MNLAEKRCADCGGANQALRGEALRELLRQVSGWETINDHHLTKTYTFPDFAKALEFVNRAGALAEAEGHHPDLLLAWGKVQVTIWTHRVDGLTEADFVLAAKCDQLPR